ncbi:MULTISPECIES: 30S ribosomal protein S1 [unclassified Fusibacter]|uniref:30S ribosomal protein S1 n=1 Tax=unclassified Fusibacter TaxID=2624464 RepID=UPI0010109189|nr:MULTISPECIES: 30S ribosomal protein S1 [unclassified Fusibacter]MCK8058825.1 30S ribosomal protein S1 [Fusibacter sp. A2]NPE21899.1 30S ribosomal protein S1 [Fusibacter sp. A1]RXV61470.1 30S ribosomal protein S1 [Fusibacter sp. A1]
MENNNLMQEMLDAFEAGFKAPRRGDVIEGKVVMVSAREVVVNVGYKADGIIPQEEVSNQGDVDLLATFHEGQELDVYVLKTDNGDGNVLLSIKRLAMDQDFRDLEPVFESGSVIPVVIKQVVKGGVIAYYKNVRGFIPASHISLRFENDLNKYINETVEVKVIEYDKRKKRAVFSRKELLKTEQASKKSEFFSTVEAGQIVEGTVKRLANFGAFVDIGGFDGLVHVTEITYGRIKSPAEYLKVNDTVKVKVLNVDSDTEKISLSIKQTNPNPWDIAEEKYQVGSKHIGRVVNTTDFGAFVELEPGVEGLVHISQIAVERIEKPSDVLKENESYEFEVLEIDTVDKKIKLSRKSLFETAETTEEA